MTSDSERIVGLYQRHAAAWDALRSPGSLFEKPWLDKFLALVPAGGSVLDLGCGAGLPISGYLIRLGRAVTGVDSSPPLIDLCRRRFPDQQWIVADMRTLDLNQPFDAILAWDSFFHLCPEDQRRMFLVFARHARSNTALMFTSGSQHGSAIGEFEGEPLYHGSLDSAEYATLLDQIGFHVVEHVLDDPACSHHTIWLARGKGRQIPDPPRHLPACLTPIYDQESDGLISASGPTHGPLSITCSESPVNGERVCGPRESERTRKAGDPVTQAKSAVVVGAQWGDEGKGKIVDVLSERFSVVARYAGGHNAGHTVIINGQKFILQLVPCGVLRPGCRGVIGNGVVLDPMAFLKETGRLRELGIDVDTRLFVSNRAQVILPYHRMIELAAESAPGRQKIGTTSRGIGPAYEDKMARNGLRVVDLLNTSLLRTHIENACREKNAIAHALFGTEPLDPAQMYDEYAAAAEKVRPFVTDTSLLLNNALQQGHSLMFEGAQGTMLDIDHGTYPFVTSSSSAAGGASTGTGVGPTRIGTVIGVTKAYVTRVGEGPFPTEIHDASGEALRARGQEYGAVTGRPRRCGWLDLPLLRYSNQINGTEWLVITKLDVLDEMDWIPVCTAWEVDGKLCDTMPADIRGIEAIRPVYTRLKGWKTSTEGVRNFDDLPKPAQEYLRFMEKETGAKIGIVSTGPDRDQTLEMPEFREAMRRITGK